MTSSAGAIEAQFAYDSYGQTAKLQGSLAADLQYASYYVHASSGLDLLATRPYSATLGRFISRDRDEEIGGTNLFAYVLNKPIYYADPFGLAPKDPCCGLSMADRRHLVDMAVLQSMQQVKAEANQAINLYGPEGAAFMNGVSPGFTPQMAVGNLADRLLKNAIEQRRKKNACLRKLLRITWGNFGPDLFSPELGEWWDITTAGEWLDHPPKYSAYGQGTPLIYIYIEQAF
jgi:RHS repeat-associated protein